MLWLLLVVFERIAHALVCLHNFRLNVYENVGSRTKQLAVSHFPQDDDNYKMRRRDNGAHSAGFY